MIHSFRTVISEIGANVGYLVSLEGFQSGSIAASELTNIELVTWTEFQELFEVSWFESFFTKEVHERLSGVMTYAEPFAPAWWDQMSDEDKQKYLALKEKYDLFGMLMESFGPYSRILMQDKNIPTLPLRSRLTAAPILLTIPDSILDEKYYREFLELAFAHGETALAEFRLIRSKYVFDQN